MAALTANTIPKATDGTHIEDSSVSDDGTTVAIGANKLTITEASGNTATAGTITQTSSSSSAIVSGPNGATNPVLQVDNSATTQADGVKIKGGAAGAGTTITAQSSGADSGFTFTPKGAGMFTLSLGRFRGPDGAAATPTYSFTNEVNTGMSLTTTNILGFYVNGIRQMDLRTSAAMFLIDDAASVSFGAGGETKLTRDSAGVLKIGNNAADASGSLKLTNLTTTATSSTGTAAILDASNVLRPLTSSLRFKENVREWRPDPAQVEAFLSLEPILWDYKDNGVKDVVGFSAEGLATVDPELVNLDAEGLPYSNREAAMIAYLHEVVKTQQKQIDELKQLMCTRMIEQVK